MSRIKTMLLLGVWRYASQNLIKSTVSWHSHLADSGVCENLRIANRAHRWGSGNLLENVEVAQFPGNKTEGCRWILILSTFSAYTVSILIFQIEALQTLDDLWRKCLTWASQYNDTGAVVIHHAGVSDHREWGQFLDEPSSNMFRSWMFITVQSCCSLTTCSPDWSS